MSNLNNNVTLLDVVNTTNTVSDTISLGNPWQPYGYESISGGEIEASSSIQVDVSDHLPNDGCQYEMIFIIAAYSTHLTVSSPLTSGAIGGVYAVNGYSYNSVIVPVDNTRIITINNVSNKKETNLWFYCNSYRKITGNSVADVNNLANISLSNINNTGKANIANFSMPSNSYIELELGPSETKYTAPANGWFCLNGKDVDVKGTFNYVMRNQTRFFGVGNCNTDTGHSPAWNGMILPAKKNDEVWCYFGGTMPYNSTNFSLRFYYCEGANNN